MDTGQIISKISMRLRRRSGRTGKSLGITGAQGRILDFILADGRERPIYQRDIEKEFDLRPSSVTEVLKGMEEQGLIQRISSETDGRYKRIVLTEAGADIWKPLQEGILKTEEQLTAGISEEELEQFMRTAKKMLANLGE